MSSTVIALKPCSRNNASSCSISSKRRLSEFFLELRPRVVRAEASLIRESDGMPQSPMPGQETHQSVRG